MAHYLLEYFWCGIQSERHSQARISTPWSAERKQKIVEIFLFAKILSQSKRETYFDPLSLVAPHPVSLVGSIVVSSFR